MEVEEEEKEEEGESEEGDDDDDGEEGVEDESEMLLSKSADVADDGNRDGIEGPSSCDFENGNEKNQLNEVL